MAEDGDGCEGLACALRWRRRGCWGCYCGYALLDVGVAYWRSLGEACQYQAKVEEGSEGHSYEDKGR